MSGFASILMQNLIGYDLLIFVIAAANVYCYFAAQRSAKKLHELLHLTIFVPEHVQKESTNITAAYSISESKLVAMRKRSNGTYSLFANLTGIFPLLGILGTVIALIPMVAEIDQLQLNFFAALTSTFWGLVFAIAFKFVDGFLSPRIEENNSDVALYLERRYTQPEGTPCETEAL